MSGVRISCNTLSTRCRQHPLKQPLKPYVLRPQPKAQDGTELHEQGTDPTPREGRPSPAIGVMVKDALQGSHWWIAIAFLVSGYDFKSPEHYPKDAAQGREAVFDGLCWKLLPTLPYHSYFKEAEWHIILEDDCEITVRGEDTVPNLLQKFAEADLTFLKPQTFIY